MDGGVWERPAMESLEALHRVFTVGHHLDIVEREKKVTMTIINLEAVSNFCIVTAKSSEEGDRVGELILPGFLQLLLRIDSVVQTIQIDLQDKQEVLKIQHDMLLQKCSF